MITNKFFIFNVFFLYDYLSFHCRSLPLILEFENDEMMFEIHEYHICTNFNITIMWKIKKRKGNTQLFAICCYNIVFFFLKMLYYFLMLYFHIFLYYICLIHKVDSTYDNRLLYYNIVMNMYKSFIFIIWYIKMYINTGTSFVLISRLADCIH